MNPSIARYTAPEMAEPVSYADQAAAQAAADHYAAIEAKAERAAEERSSERVKEKCAKALKEIAPISAIAPMLDEEIKAAINDGTCGYIPYGSIDDIVDTVHDLALEAMRGAYEAGYMAGRLDPQCE
jgi:hypothetical protein